MLKFGIKMTLLQISGKNTIFSHFLCVPQGVWDGGYYITICMTSQNLF